ncbi:MAG: hypothetical protein HY899_01595 [Deltaproteobacteria bacterium]|nr:hypothetical protein [Deltaproteobacteria bacterium]
MADRARAHVRCGIAVYSTWSPTKSSRSFSIEAKRLRGERCIVWRAMTLG